MTPNLYPLKKIISAIIVLIAASCNSSVTKNVKPNNKYKNNWKTHNLRGRIKSITEFNFKQYVPYSELTNYIREEHFTFDSTGNLVGKSIFAEPQMFHYRYIYQYDKVGNYIECESYERNDSTADVQTYKFDELDNMIETVRHDPNNHLTIRVQYYFDKNGNCIESLEEKPSSLRTKYTYTYDSLNRPLSIMEIRDYGDNKPSSEKTVFRYNGDSVEKKLDGIHIKWHYLTVYNKDHQEVFWKNLHPGEDFVNTTKFDSLGNEIEHKAWKGTTIDDRNSRHYEYVYDDKGNWTKRTLSKLNGKLITSVERKIEYY